MIMVPGDTIGLGDLAFLDGSGAVCRTTIQRSRRCRCTKRASASNASTSSARSPRSRGNMSRTADALGVERSNLYRKMRAFGIAPARKEEEPA